MEQTKNPSILSTRIEILKFKLNNAHEIPPEHHFNLITPGGCSDKTFARYINSHSLIDEAVLLMLEQTSPRFQIWRKRNNLPERIEKAFVEKNGALPLLKYPVQLSAESSETLLKPEFADELLPYMTNVAKLSGECSKSLNYDVGLLTFSPKGEAMLLELKNNKLAAAYLQHNHLYKGNENLLLLYDDANVYEAFCRCNSFSPDLAEAAIKEKSPDVLRIVIRQYGWFSGRYEIYRECEIISPDGSVLRPDRVLIKDDEAVVIDYKFGEYRPGNPKYVRQIRAYMRLLSALGFSKVSGALWYVNEDKVENCYL